MPDADGVRVNSTTTERVRADRAERVLRDLRARLLDWRDIAHADAVLGWLDELEARQGEDNDA